MRSAFLFALFVIFIVACAPQVEGAMTGPQTDDEDSLELLLPVQMIHNKSADKKILLTESITTWSEMMILKPK